MVDHFFSKNIPPLPGGKGGIFSEQQLLTIYTLSIDPYTLWLLTYEGLQNEGYITYWDHKTRELKSQQIKTISIQLNKTNK